MGKEIRTGRIYLLRIGDELMANRLEYRPGGVLAIRSDNKDYDDLPVIGSGRRHKNLRAYSLEL